MLILGCQHKGFKLVETKVNSSGRWAAKGWRQMIGGKRWEVGVSKTCILLKTCISGVNLHAVFSILNSTNSKGLFSALIRTQFLFEAFVQKEYLHQCIQTSFWIIDISCKWSCQNSLLESFSTQIRKAGLKN